MSFRHLQKYRPLVDAYYSSRSAAYVAQLFLDRIDQIAQGKRSPAEWDKPTKEWKELYEIANTLTIGSKNVLLVPLRPLEKLPPSALHMLIEHSRDQYTQTAKYAERAWITLDENGISEHDVRYLKIVSLFDKAERNQKVSNIERYESSLRDIDRMVKQISSARKTDPPKRKH